MTAKRTITLKRGAKYGIDDLIEATAGNAIANARAKIMSSSITKQTDSTTGTVSTSAVGEVVIPPAFTVTGTDASPKAGFDTEVGKLNNAFASFANYINPILRGLGKDAIVFPSASTITAALPAQDKTLTAVTGAANTAVEVVTGQAALKTARDNLATMAWVCNDIATSLGFNIFPDNSKGSAYKVKGVPTFQTIATTTTGTTGTALNTLADTAVDTALTAIVGGIASLSAFINFVIDPDVDGNLTDSTGATASTALPPVVEAMTSVVAAYQDGSTDSAPKAGFDTAMASINGSFADLALKANQLVRYAGNSGIGYLTDSTGGSANTTLASITTNLTAVDGTGSNSLANAGTSAILANVMNNIATLTAKYNELSAWYGLTPLTDSSTGTASTSSTLVAIASSGAGVDNGAAATGCADSVIDTFLLAAANNIATLGARANALDDFGDTMPLRTVVGL